MTKGNKARAMTRLDDCHEVCGFDANDPPGVKLWHLSLTFLEAAKAYGIDPAQTMADAAFSMEL